MNDEALKSLWQSQPVTTEVMPFERLEHAAVGFRRLILRRNLQEYIAGLFVIAAFGYFAWTLPMPLVRIGCVLEVLGGLFVMFQLHRHASIGELPAERLALPYLSYYREQLVRQRDLLRSVWLWYIGPLVPGFCVMFWGMAQPNPADFPWQITAVIIVPCMVVIAMNVRVAKQIQGEIDKLDQLAD
jgi:hypothetical protein